MRPCCFRYLFANAHMHTPVLKAYFRSDLVIVTSSRSIHVSCMPS